MNKHWFKIVSGSVICVLLTLAGLQIFWLKKMYNSGNEELKEKINAAIERTAYEELSERGTGPKYLTTTLSGLSASKINKINITNTDSTVVGTGQTFLFDIKINKDSNVVNIRKTINKTIDENTLLRYDTLLTRNLEKKGIYLSHRLSLVDKINNATLYNGKIIHYDTLSKQETAIQNPLIFYIPIRAKENERIRLEIENPNSEILKQMLWIIISSALIILVLGFSFYYLLRTLFIQKTMEQVKSDFTSNITHELKTPISIAAAANEALLHFSAYDNPIKREEYLRITQQQLKLLTNMVERILSISIKERENFKLNISGCNMQEIMQNLIKNYSVKYDDIPHKNIKFSLSITPDNLILQLDKFYFTNIISNLIDNAINYSNKEVEIKIEIKEGEVLISDNGLGIAKQEINRIFDKFYRISTGNLHNVKGFGLGLYYTKLIVEKHGWKIDVISKLGEGSTFRIINN